MRIFGNKQIFGLQPTFSPIEDVVSFDIDSAVSHLDEQQEAENNPPPKAPAAAAEGAQEDAGEPNPDEGQEGADEPLIEAAEGEQEGAGESPPLVKPPTHWAAEDKALFASLPPELQTKVAAYEKQAEAATSASIQRSTEAKQAYEVAVKGIEPLKTKLDEAVAYAVANHQNRWSQIDWPAEMAKDFQRATTAKALMEQEQAGVQKLLDQQKEVTQAQETEFLKAQAIALPDVAKEMGVPELVDVKTGRVLRTKTANYIISTLGVQPEQLKHLSAHELTVAYKAMKFDEIQTALKERKAAPKTSAAATVTKTPISKPSAAPALSGPVASLKVANQRLSNTGKISDAVAVLDKMQF